MSIRTATLATRELLIASWLFAQGERAAVTGATISGSAKCL